MGQTATTVTAQLADLLRGEDGVNSAAANLQTEDPLAPLDVNGILELHAPVDLTEKTASVKYPVIHVYCDRLVNSLKEKFRTFSGKADLNVEIRVSHDHLGPLQTQLHNYIQAITDVLDRNRGNWALGTFYAGGYEVVFSPVRRGGRNYLQSARVRLEVHIQTD